MRNAQPFKTQISVFHYLYNILKSLIKYSIGTLKIVIVLVIYMFVFIENIKN